MNNSMTTEEYKAYIARQQGIPPPTSPPEKPKKPRGLSEDEFQQQIIDYAHLRGWRVAHFRPAQLADGRWVTPVQADGKGFPDLLMIRGTRLLVAELKVGKNTVADDQWEWINAFRGVYGNVECHIWHPSDWKVIEGELTRT